MTEVLLNKNKLNESSTNLEAALPTKSSWKIVIAMKIAPNAISKNSNPVIILQNFWKMLSTHIGLLTNFARRLKSVEFLTQPPTIEIRWRSSASFSFRLVYQLLVSWKLHPTVRKSIEYFDKMLSNTGTGRRIIAWRCRARQDIRTLRTAEGRNEAKNPRTNWNSWNWVHCELWGERVL